MELERKAKKFWRNLRRTQSPLPEEVQVEITNRCNLRCPMCPRLVLGVPDEDMPAELFAALLPKLHATRILTLTGWGEPLAHPRLIELIGAANSALPRAETRFTTNGYLMDEAFLDALGTVDVHQVTFSVDSAREEGGQAPGHPPREEIIARIERLLARRDDRGLPRVRVQTLMFKDGRADIETLLGRLSALDLDDVALVRLDTRFDPTLERPTWPEERALVRHLRDEGRRLGLPVSCVNEQHLLMRLAGHGDTHCLRLDNGIYINVRGQVTPCCLLHAHACGDLTRESLAEIWHGGAFQEFRDRQHIYCRGCDALTYRYASDIK